jgi:hypothetical protein
MTLDIKGGLKNTSISHNRYVVFEELLSNAIDSYLIRRSIEPDTPSLHIELGVEFFRNSLIADTHDVAIWCEDNGAGFGDEQIKAFVTKDSTYKDYLQIQGIGKCKGAGRIQFFHFFSQLEIDSVYNSGNERWRRKILVNSEAREIAEQDFVKEPTSEVVKTRLMLKRLNEKTLGALFDITTLRNDFTALTIQHFLRTAFLQRFIVLKNLVGEFSINIVERENGESACEVINSDQLPAPAQVIPISVTCGHRDDACSYKLKLTRYSILEEDSPSLEHEIALCANSAIVTSLTKYFLKSAPDRRRPIDGKIELLLVEGEVLDQKVNVQRDGFNIPKECSNGREFSEDISLEDIVESLEETVFGILTPSDFNRE